MGGTYMFLQMPSQIGILGLDVRAANGNPVKNALITTVTTSIRPGVTPSSLNQALDTQTLFVGQSDSTGFAAIPGVAGNSTVMAVGVASGSSPNAALIGINTVQASLPLPIFPKLIDRITMPLITPILPNPPPQLQPCKCPVLAVLPSRIPAPNSSVFRVGDPPVKLKVLCQLDDVTSSTLIEDVLGLIVGGEVHFTSYLSENPNVALVDLTAGVITAVSPGETRIMVSSQSLELVAVEGGYFPHNCRGIGFVDRVIVSASVDLTGNWAGTATVTENGSTTDTIQVSAAITQTANSITGTVVFMGPGDVPQIHTETLQVNGLNFSLPVTSDGAAVNITGNFTPDGLTMSGSGADPDESASGSGAQTLSPDGRHISGNATGTLRLCNCVVLVKWDVYRQ